MMDRKRIIIILAVLIGVSVTVYLIFSSSTMKERGKEKRREKRELVREKIVEPEDIEEDNKEEVNMILRKFEELKNNPLDDIEDWDSVHRIHRGGNSLKVAFGLIKNMDPVPHEVRVGLSELIWFFQEQTMLGKDCKKYGEKFGYISYDGFFNHLTPIAGCEAHYRAGKTGVGGNTICNFQKIRPDKNSPCRMYSFGSTSDLSFELEVGVTMGCEVHVFHPNLSETQSKKLKDSVGTQGDIFFQKFSLGYVGGTNTEGSSFPTKPFSDITKELGHDYVTILKTEVKSEKNIIPSIFNKEDNILEKMDVKYIFAKFHATDPINSHPKSCEVMIKELYPWIKTFHDNGYFMVAHEANVAVRSEHFFSFLRKDLI